MTKKSSERRPGEKRDKRLYQMFYCLIVVVIFLVFGVIAEIVRLWG